MTRIHAVAIIAAALLIPAAAQAQDVTRRDPRSYAPARVAELNAKIPEQSARSIALARMPQGTVAASELKLEHGTLVYIYDVTVPGKDGLQEIKVSALDGQVISVEHLGSR